MASSSAQSTASTARVATALHAARRRVTKSLLPVGVVGRWAELGLGAALVAAGHQCHPFAKWVISWLACSDSPSGS